MKHTPGPWKTPAASTVTHDRGTICTVWKPDKFSGGNQKANARLIAAAPELYRACQNLIAAWGAVTSVEPLLADKCCATINAAKAALNQAEGK